MIEGSVIPPGQGPSNINVIVVPTGDPQAPFIEDTGISMVPNPGTGTDVTPATDPDLSAP